MRVRAADTPKYAKKQMSRETTIPTGMERIGFFASSPADKNIRWLNEVFHKMNYEYLL